MGTGQAKQDGIGRTDYFILLQYYFPLRTKTTVRMLGIHSLRTLQNKSLKIKKKKITQCKKHVSYENY